jgi:nitrous oxide reductase
MKLALSMPRNFTSMALLALTGMSCAGTSTAMAQTTDRVYLQTVVWASKEDPGAKRTVKKLGEVYGFAPSTITVREGDHVDITIRNLEAGGDDGHTFTVPAYNINKTIAPLSTVNVSFVADKSGVFPFMCEFHKPWMAGRLVVLPQR